MNEVTVHVRFDVRAFLAEIERCDLALAQLRERIHAHTRIEPIRPLVRGPVIETDAPPVRLPQVRRDWRAWLDAPVDQLPHDPDPDNCWRCDAADAVDDLGLCEGCRVALVDPAASR